MRNIIKAVDLPANTLWPYSLSDNDIICAWLDVVEDRRALVSAGNLLQRCIRQMTAMSKGDPNDGIRFYDGKIWKLLCRFEHREDPPYRVSKGPDGQIVLIGYREGHFEPEIIPCYTTSIEAALGLWPVKDRPERWEGTAWACCVAGLQARKAHIIANRQGL